MKYLEKFLPKAAQPYAAEIVGGTAGYFLGQKVLGRSAVARMMSIPAGVTIGSTVTEGVRESAVPNLIGLALAYAVSVRPPRFIRQMHKKSRFSFYAVPTAAFAVGKMAAKKLALKYEGKNWDDLKEANLMADFRKECPDLYKELYKKTFNKEAPVE